ncbi:enoyl-CoA hydratase [Crenobacter cavernae]|uniref:Enoyl-CoA hydratase n=1 Tax=Crenobacter cavernae TaxID=2290923 RepID=A0ABY0F9N2_9NEIS|nr:enoyl-CoA hydratase [Crenobacter cavernae]RXZ42186.1 enoyl-CoA hydratase [Crenobacter cavernae]
MAKQLIVEKLGKCAILTHVHPPANVWTVDGLLELKDALSGLSGDAEVYAVVLTGEGEQFFSAGADLSVFKHGDRREAAAIIDAFASAFGKLRTFPGVTVAAINGYALGGGLECALACDFMVAERGARLGLPETRVGLVPCAGGTKTLTDKVGLAWAKRMILGGELVDAEEARRIGLVEEVVDVGLAKITAISLANKVGQQAPGAVAVARSLIAKSPQLTLDAQLSLEREGLLGLVGEAEQIEGVSAFLEKRAPSWQDEGDDDD